MSLSTLRSAVFSLVACHSTLGELLRRGEHLGLSDSESLATAAAKAVTPARASSKEA